MARYYSLAPRSNRKKKVWKGIGYTAAALVIFGTAFFFSYRLVASTQTGVVEIESLKEQIRGLKADVTAREEKIQSLEMQLENLQKAQASQPAANTGATGTAGNTGAAGNSKNTRPQNQQQKQPAVQQKPTQPTGGQTGNPAGGAQPAENPAGDAQQSGTPEVQQPSGTADVQQSDTPPAAGGAQ